MKQHTRFRYIKPIEHKRAEFREIYEELLDACKIYDQGTTRKFRTMVGALYMLLHDGGRQKSLLRRLSARDGLLLPDSASLFQSGSFGAPLASIHVPDGKDDRVVFTARLDACASSDRRRFGKWWEGAVFSPRPNLKLSRRKLINVMRSQDGSFGHSDDELRDEAYCYFELKGAPHMRWFRTGDGKIIEVCGQRLFSVPQSPVARLVQPQITAGPYRIFLGPQATVRQIAWELDVALRESGHLAKLLA